MAKLVTNLMASSCAGEGAVATEMASLTPPNLAISTLTLSELFRLACKITWSAWMYRWLISSLRP